MIDPDKLKPGIIAEDAGGAIIFTGESATRLYQIRVVMAGLKLDKQGIKIRRGVSMIKVAQALTGTKTKDHDALLEELKQLVARIEENVTVVNNDKE